LAREELDLAAEIRNVPKQRLCLEWPLEFHTTSATRHGQRGHTLVLINTSKTQNSSFRAFAFDRAAALRFLLHPKREFEKMNLN